MKSYSEKLSDPRWQKKRLEIMQRDGFKCINCQSTEKTLNVHHVVYQRGLEPWEYGQSLITLCEECHAERHQAQNNLLICTSRFTNDQINSLASFYGLFFGIKHVEE